MTTSEAVLQVRKNIRTIALTVLKLRGKVATDGAGMRRQELYLPLSKFKIKPFNSASIQ